MNDIQPSEPIKIGPNDGQMLVDRINALAKDNELMKQDIDHIAESVVELLAERDLNIGRLNFIWQTLDSLGIDVSEVWSGPIQKAPEQSVSSSQDYSDVIEELKEHHSFISALESLEDRLQTEGVAFKALEKARMRYLANDVMMTLDRLHAILVLDRLE